MYMNNLKTGKHDTTDLNLGIEVSKYLRLPAIEHIKPNLKPVFIRAYPELNKIIKIYKMLNVRHCFSRLHFVLSSIATFRILLCKLFPNE